MMHVGRTCVSSAAVSQGSEIAYRQTHTYRAQSTIVVSVSQIRRHFEHKTYESDDRDSSVCYQITFDFSICFAVWLGRYGIRKKQGYLGVHKVTLKNYNF